MPYNDIQIDLFPACLDSIVWTLQIVRNSGNSFLIRQLLSSEVDGYATISGHKRTLSGGGIP